MPFDRDFWKYLCAEGIFFKAYTITLHTIFLASLGVSNISSDKVR